MRKQRAQKGGILLGGRIESVEKMTLPGTDIERSFVFVKKEKPTPKKYPRKAGLPSKSRWGERIEKMCNYKCR